MSVKAYLLVKVKSVVLQVGLEEKTSTWAIDVIERSGVGEGARDTDGVIFESSAGVEGSTGWVVDREVDTSDEVGTSDLRLERVAVGS